MNGEHLPRLVFPRTQASSQGVVLSQDHFTWSCVMILGPTSLKRQAAPQPRTLSVFRIHLSQPDMTARRGSLLETNLRSILGAGRTGISCLASLMGLSVGWLELHLVLCEVFSLFWRGCICGLAPALSS